ncbi:MAG TPA: NfeD family protein [Firmicutes bacterium]|nr:NfeD family protein [Bacillota bacterium]
MEWSEIFSQYGWIFAAAAMFLIELATPGAFFGFILGLAAVITFVLSLFISNFLIQLFIFIVLSIISFFYLRPLFLKLTQKSVKVRTQHEELIHEKGIVTKRILPTKPGIILVKGQEWSAFSEEIIEKGEEVQLEQLDGISYRVTKIGSK